MMSLSMVEAKLPPGFRFHPKDEELIDYLKKKVACCDGDQPPLIMIIEVDLNKCEPWDIPETACVGGKERYFYSKRDKKYATGLRTNRATLSGYWKATGKDKPVIKKGVLVGMRKTLVFYKGRAPKGKKTDWVMHEFRLEGPLALLNLSSLKEDWVLCRVFLKNRDIVTKHDHADHNYSYGGQTSTSSLPPLMDPYITSHRTQNHPNEHEQVPCFSIFAADQPFSYLTHMDQLPNFSTKIMPTFGSLPPDLGAYLNVNNTSSCHEQKVIKTVWNPNIIMGSPSFAEATTSDSFLSEVDLSTMWNNQC